MSLLPVFQWLTNTPAFALMRNSKWAFAIVEMIHLLALTGLGGVVLLVDLGVLGVGLRRRPIANFARELSPIFGWCLATMIVSGALLVTAEPMKCYYHPAFRLKMVLFAVALIFAFTVHRKSVNSAGEPPLLGLKLAAVASLTLWLGVGLAGRAIGFL